MYSAIVFLPLLGCLIAGLLGRVVGDRPTEILTTALVGIAALLSWIAFLNVGFGHEEARVTVLPWITSGTLNADWAFRIDTLTAVMLVVVTTVSSLVHLYSIGYMSHDPHRTRFFCYLSLFTFAMLMLVTSDNLLQLFFGWEGVGLASYLLIGFWYQKPSANAAAIKAFLVNRVGDIGFALGIIAAFLIYGSIEFDAIFANAASAQGQTIHFLGADIDAVTLICLLLFMGAMGKSAQFILHTWLPDAMEGPTPVSALIHAATMVTAGVFLVARMSPLFEMSEAALLVVTFIGAFTAFFAATVGLVQNDIKRVIAYSTCSQLGYMFAALGVGAYSAAIFHLFTHAFFKALLFLGSGSVIHAMSDEQDMRRMGGLRKLIPTTYWMMIIGTLALTGFGIPFIHIGTAGFMSKDIVIEAAFAANTAASDFAFVLLVVAALMTSFYSWRLIFMTFHGKARGSADVMSHVHESPQVMLIPLYVLAVGALAAGMVYYEPFVGHHFQEFWNGSIAHGMIEDHGELTTIIDAAHHVPTWVVLSPTIAMILGFGLAYLFYIVRPSIPVTLAREQDLLYRFLLNKWYIDEIYDVVFVRPAMFIGRFFWKGVDGGVIDRFGPDGMAAAVVTVTRRVTKLQTGYIYHYAFAMIIGVAALVTWFMFAGGVR